MYENSKFVLRGCTADNDANKAVVQVGPKKICRRKNIINLI